MFYCRWSRQNCLVRTCVYMHFRQVIERATQYSKEAVTVHCSSSVTWPTLVKEKIYILMVFSWVQELLRWHAGLPPTVTLYPAIVQHFQNQQNPCFWANRIYYFRIVTTRIGIADLGRSGVAQMSDVSCHTKHSHCTQHSGFHAEEVWRRWRHTTLHYTMLRYTTLHYTTSISVFRTPLGRGQDKTGTEDAVQWWPRMSDAHRSAGADSILLDLQ